MEVRIGVRDVGREVTFESAQTPEAVRQAVTEALTTQAPVVELQDDKGRTVIVPTTTLAYVEIGAQDKGRVGFGSH
ncbi:ATP-binding protein [Serinicoccus sp. CNJ-927]|uniref:DUF3107 domain-containing protein n=1 Tax=Serinicoccus TaxID=265976 RepID=UPI0003B764C2|nr:MULTISPECIES: DUF3107 domain-containing protein [Serinicoccus]OLT17294.1 ATP-binding protein [Serinicoccus sp. CUA-874]OLT39680.1 ATP-binding protein [Serinicoccus sp. CNJ-927]